LKCPFCSSDDTKVIDSRPADDNTSIRRRRQCEACGKRFTTYEKLETMPLMVIKKDNSRESYDRSKLESGLVRSCHKRPVSTEQISRMIDEIENELYMLGEKEIQTSVIGEKVMKKLKDLDEVAYVRFASVYREFKDVNTFIDEIGKLLKTEKKARNRGNGEKL
jgi:transcriptional repressor NrdR